MKIAYLSTSHFPSDSANSVHVMKMCQAFARNGHQVQLHAEGSGDAGARDVYFPDYDVDGIFDLVLRKAGSRAISLYNSVMAGIDAQSADLAYARNPLAALLAASLGKSTILELHTPISDRPAVRFAFETLLKRQSLKRVVVISAALRDYYARRYPALEQRIFVAPDGADPFPDHVTPARLPAGGEKFQVGYVGHLYAGKGMELIAELAPLCSWAHFTVVGGREHEVQYWRSRCARTPNLSILGHKPHREIVRYLAAFNAVLLPNQHAVRSAAGKDISEWTSPLKMFEYMSAGKAIVASDLPILKEVLVDGHNAILCPPEQPAKWNTALQRLSSDQEAKRKLETAALADFQRYTWQGRARRVIEA